MIYLTLGLIAMAGLVAYVRWSDTRLLSALIADHNAERAKLLDRIQHPEVRQVVPSEIVIHEPPGDPAEMAFVGREVPEFVSVGTGD